MAVYVLSVQKWNFDGWLQRYLWRPFKWIGQLFGAVGRRGVVLAGSTAAGIVGYLCLQRLRAIEGDLPLDQYHGHSYEQPGLTLVFLVACLGMAGFPITPTFIGIDLLFTHISAEQLALMLLTALNFLFIELTLLRIYARIFLGQHKKAYHPIAFKSS